MDFSVRTFISQTNDHWLDNHQFLCTPRSNIYAKLHDTSSNTLQHSADIFKKSRETLAKLRLENNNQSSFRRDKLSPIQFLNFLTSRDVQNIYFTVSTHQISRLELMSLIMFTNCPLYHCRLSRDGFPHPDDFTRIIRSEKKKAGSRKARPKIIIIIRSGE